jgi:hypothetical protein
MSAFDGSQSFTWRWAGGDKWNGAEYSIHSNEGRCVALVRYPGYRHLTECLKIGHARVVSDDGDFYFKSRWWSRCELRSTLNHDVVGQYEYRNRGKGKGGLITVGEGTSFHVHINGWGAYEAPKASMVLVDDFGRRLLEFGWRTEGVYIFDLPATHARRFHFGRACSPRGEPVGVPDLAVVLGFHLFMRPYLVGGGG